MHGHINVKSPNNTSKWHMGFNSELKGLITLLKPAGYVMHQQFNIQQLYVLPTLYLYFVFI